MPSGDKASDVPSCYRPLIEFLAETPGDEIALTYREVMAVIGGSLPASAISGPTGGRADGSGMGRRGGRWGGGRMPARLIRASASAAMLREPARDDARFGPMGPTVTV